jgi:hypothetical protein
LCESANSRCCASCGAAKWPVPRLRRPGPSFFQSSLPSKPDERAQTLKKIDEIEAQMSMQWWKTKHRDTSINSSMFPTSGPSQSAPPAAPLRRCPAAGAHAFS